MSKGLVYTSVGEVKTAAMDWLKGRDLRKAEGPISVGRVKDGSYSCVRGVGAPYLATVRFRSVAKGSAVEVRARPRAYWNAILHVVLFVLVGWSLVLIHQLLGEWTSSGICWLAFCVGLVISLIYWKDNWLSSRLARIEQSFWDLAESRHDVQRQTRADGQLYRQGSRLLTELVLAGCVAAICGMILGGWGVVLALALCVSVLVMIITEISRGDNPVWHWRLWVMGNMGRWTFVMLGVCAVAPVLVTMEAFMELEMYKDPDSYSFMRAVEEGEFRSIRPATAELLEADIASRFCHLSAPERKDDRSLERHIFIFRGHGVVALAVFIAPVVLFVLLPFRALLRSQGQWTAGIGEKDADEGPHVPYLPKAWTWRVPPLLRGVIVFHAVFGGLIQLAATAFCVEGFSYAFFGRTVLWSQTANLWSWIFAIPKILFGDPAGWWVGLALVATISCPVLMMFGAFVRRSLEGVLLAMRVRRVSWAGKKDCLPYAEQIERFIENVCSREDISRPVLRLISSDDIAIRLRGTLLSKTAVVEISQGAARLLSEDELRAVIAHELGHLSQGIRRIGVLKLLSSLAMFPNHYLTLCLNWSASEIGADRFALTVTGDREALQRAVVKMSVAQMDCLRSSVSRPSAETGKGGKERGILRRMRGALRIEYGSMRFFFGDGLFGYAHPYVSERLEAIGSSCQEAASES